MFRLSTNWAPRQQLRDSCLTGYSAYSQDLTGCAATGATRSEVEREMREAIDFHIEGLLLTGERFPSLAPWLRTVKSRLKSSKAWLSQILLPPQNLHLKQQRKSRNFCFAISFRFVRLS